jgi:hypothetical protein
VAAGRRPPKNLYCPAEQARAVYDRISGMMQMVWLPTTTHIGFYDDDAYIAPAATTAFLGRTLG